MKLGKKHDKDYFSRCLLGDAVGDALGLPVEFIVMVIEGLEN